MASYIDLNDLGSFASINALWAAYPEGGQDGDYCTIDSVKYRWDKYDRMWVADPNFGPTPARSVTAFDGDVNMQNNLTVAGYIRAKGIKQPCVGLFGTLAALQSKWPDPEVGMWALVGNSVSSTSPAAVYRCDTEGTWTATGGTAYIDDVDLSSITINGIKNWVLISSTSDLPSSPTINEQGKGYLLGTTLYVYVGTGGDTLSGKYQSAQLKGPKGDPGGQLEGYVTVVNDLTTGGDEDVLSAEQGKVLNETKLYSVDMELPDVSIDIKFRLTQIYTKIISSESATKISKGDSLEITLSPDEGYVVGTIRVMMSGENITSIAYDEDDNVISIASVTGDVYIVATGVEEGMAVINFVDPVIEAICVENWDTDGDGMISLLEAQAVTHLGSGYSEGSKFKGNTDIVSFDELNKFGVTELYESSFEGCTSLESINISNISALTTRSSFGKTFEGCTSLKKVKTGDLLTAIPLRCFYNCSSLEVIDIGEAVTSIGATALQNCNALTTIVMRSTTPPNYEYTWKKRGGKLYVPDAAFDTYQATDWGTNYPAVADQYGTQMLPLSDYVEE